MSTLKLLLFLFALSIVSCSNETYEEEDMDVTDPETSPTTYVPNTLGDYWVYDVEPCLGYDMGMWAHGPGPRAR